MLPTHSTNKRFWCQLRNCSYRHSPQQSFFCLDVPPTLSSTPSTLLHSNPAVLRPFNPANLQPSNAPTLHFFDNPTLRPSNSSTLQTSTPSTLQCSNPPSLQPSNHLALEPSHPTHPFNKPTNQPSMLLLQPANPATLYCKTPTFQHFGPTRRFANPPTLQPFFHEHTSRRVGSQARLLRGASGKRNLGKGCDDGVRVSCSREAKRLWR